MGTGKINTVTAIVITVSDSCFTGTRQDLSGPAVVQRLMAAGFTVIQTIVLPDDAAQISAALRLAAPQARLVVTTGGTGIGPRDVTPEATRAVCDRILDGPAEQMRREGLKDTPLAPLSRAICGTRGSTLLLNLPGNPRGAVHSLEAVLPLLPHALALLAGETAHPTAGLPVK
ncbi:MAG: MogA/MoaB family molybdenum cofactor biosynthesis protein [Acidobacteriaceae bacterium]